MNDLDVTETEKVVKGWEDLDQKELSALFSDYLYRVKEWTKGNKAWELTEHNIHKFKGITRQDNFPYAIFYKGAFSYVDSLKSMGILQRDECIYPAKVQQRQKKWGLDLWVVFCRFWLCYGK